MPYILIRLKIVAEPILLGKSNLLNGYDLDIFCSYNGGWFR